MNHMTDRIIKIEETQKNGHAAGFFTIIIWATTFVSTKILLKSFEPVEILFFRFLLGLILLCILAPGKLKITEKRMELYYGLAGLSGICVYYLLENIALVYTQASNVGVIISVAPFFTALISRFAFPKKERLSPWFFGGFAVAMAGIFLISFQGKSMEVNPLGDFLSILAAFSFACYSVLMRKIGEFGHGTIQSTRRVFAYGLLFMIPVLFFSPIQPDFQRFFVPVNLLNLLFLGVGASALCFVWWNFAVKVLGAVKTSIYIYLVPVVTVLASVLILKEKITWISGIGIMLTIAGLFLSEKQSKSRESRKINEIPQNP